MPSFGEKLKQEREKRKISLEQISVTTKIGTRMLQALEEDKFAQLPGGIFNKGFVRAYARAVGLDEDQAVTDYLQASGDAPPVSTEVAVRENEARENAEHVRQLERSTDGPFQRLPLGLFAAILLVVALVLSLWTHRSREREKQLARLNQTSATAQTASTVQTSKSAPGATQSVEPAKTPDSGQDKADKNNDKSNKESAAGSPNSANSVNTPAASGSAAPTANPNEFQLVVHARNQSWVSMNIDGVAGPSRILEAGDQHSARGKNQIILKVGNAGGVDVLFNGKKLPVSGEEGEVKTMTFGPQGVIPNALEPPATMQ